jgi:hypothetical protein
VSEANTVLSLPAGETRSEATQRGPHQPKVSVAISSPLCPPGISPKRGEEEGVSGANTAWSLPKVSGAQSSISDSHGARHLSAEICGHAEADSSSGETRSEATQRGPHQPKMSVAISSPPLPSGHLPQRGEEGSLCPPGFSPKVFYSGWLLTRLAGMASMVQWWR